MQVFTFSAQHNLPPSKHAGFLVLRNRISTDKVLSSFPYIKLPTTLIKWAPIEEKAANAIPYTLMLWTTVEQAKEIFRSCTWQVVVELDERDDRLPANWVHRLHIVLNLIEVAAPPRHAVPPFEALVLSVSTPFPPISDFARAHSYEIAAALGRRNRKPAIIQLDLRSFWS